MVTQLGYVGLTFADPRRPGVSYFANDGLRAVKAAYFWFRLDKAWFYTSEIMDNEGEFCNGEWIHPDWPHKGPQRPFLDAHSLLAPPMGRTGDFTPPHPPAQDRSIWSQVGHLAQHPCPHK